MGVKREEPFGNKHIRWLVGIKRGGRTGNPTNIVGFPEETTVASTVELVPDDKSEPGSLSLILKGLHIWLVIKLWLRFLLKVD